MKSLNKRKLCLFAIDLACFSLVYVILVLLIQPIAFDWVQFLVQALIIGACVFTMRLIFRMYSNVWRYATSGDYFRLVLADFLGGCLYLIVSRAFMSESLQLWRVLPVVAVSALLSLSLRFCYQIYLQHRRGRHSDSDKKLNVAIIGAGSIGALLMEELSLNNYAKYRPYCFFDTDPQKIGNTLGGLKVYAADEHVVEKIKSMPVEEIIIAMTNLDSGRKKELFDLYNQTGCRVRIYDFPLDTPNNGERHLRDFKIEELLFRKSIDFTGKDVSAMYKDKTVLITGGGGSIGSELSRQVAAMHPKRLILLDIYENTVYNIQQDLRMMYGRDVALDVEIASITDIPAIDAVFAKYRPDIVLHAAAHKHVPLMENNCAEAVRNNVFGTLNLVNAAEKYKVKRFLMISTDKAVNPTNIMGATKRMCEMIIQSRKDSETDFVAVRFGNVLGSNGSVIPLFRKQIEAGGPVTITDKRIIRYFMTIPEAAQLVLCSSAMAEKSEIYVLDMGQPVKILSLAENMIRLSGLEPYRDIDIKEVGLREGEKLYEELLIKTEELDKTDNEMIFIERDKPLSREEIDSKLAVLKAALSAPVSDLDTFNANVRAAAKKVVPTYHSPEEVNKTAAESQEMRNVKKDVAQAVTG